MHCEMMLTLALTLAADSSPFGRETYPESLWFSKTYIPSNLYLVRAKTEKVEQRRVTSVLKEGGARPKVGWTAPIGTFVIIEVYAGRPGWRKGEKFEYFNPDPGGGSAGMHLIWNDRKVYGMEEGVETLWWVYYDDKEKRFKPEVRAVVVDAFHLRRFPYFNNKHGSEANRIPVDAKAEYKEALAFAKEVGRIYRAKVRERPALLQRQASVEGSPFAGWAITMLARGNPKGHLDFLKKLAEKDNMDTESQITLDKTLCWFDSDDWTWSVARRRMLARWFDPERRVKDLALFHGTNRLLDASRGGQVDLALYKEIVAPLLLRSDKLTAHQLWLLGRLLREARYQKEDRQEAFKWLTGLVKESKSSVVRAHAASGLANLRPLSDKQVEAVRALAVGNRDAKVLTELGVVLASPYLTVPIAPSRRRPAR